MIRQLRFDVLLLISTLAFASGFAGEIREFSIPTLERLGNELYRRDALAATASDLVLKTQPLAKSLKMRGWITELGKNENIVYWIAETASGPSLAYMVTFRGSAKPQVEDRRGQPLPPKIAVRYKARQTATEALKGKLYNINYNFEVLNDPDGSGFLVYALAATPKSDEVVLAGHFRVTVSADSEKAERVDALSRSLLVIDKDKGVPSGGKTVGAYATQLVSNKPVETFIYTSRLIKMPIVVATPPDGRIWEIENSKMKDTGKSVGKK
jgi:hypothetical protein